MRIVIDTQSYDDVTLGQVKNAVLKAPLRLLNAGKVLLNRRYAKTQQAVDTSEPVTLLNQ